MGFFDGIGGWVGDGLYNLVKRNCYQRLKSETALWELRTEETQLEVITYVTLIIIIIIRLRGWIKKEFVLENDLAKSGQVAVGLSHNNNNYSSLAKELTTTAEKASR